MNNTTMVTATMPTTTQKRGSTSTSLLQTMMSNVMYDPIYIWSLMVFFMIVYLVSTIYICCKIRKIEKNAIRLPTQSHALASTSAMGSNVNLPRM